ncbi:hypothetical protein [Maribellus sediminis]|uniref:hypothetical protein n=1 Tax=Maribellus sediminis TaxID=2696285 RepID=UPI0014312035|nr:hypothetical protein [Maribellus sediminis]
MRKPFQILIITVFSYLSVCGTENYPAGARAVALSNAFVSVSDVWSTFHNQATLSQLEAFSAGVFYESRYLVDELSLAAGTVNMPAIRGTVGFSFYQLGKGTYKESKLGLAYSKKLSQRLSAALQLDYFLYRFPENDGAKGFPTFEAGASYQTTKELTLAMHVFNPVMNGFETAFGKQKLPLILRIGGHYQFADKSLVSFEIQKNTNSDAQVKAGLEFYLVKNLALRFGVSGRPVQISSGLGYSFGKFSTDIAFSYHGNLGFTPSVSINYKL